MASKAAQLRAEESIKSTLAQADQVVTLHDAAGLAAQKELLHVLEQADAELAKRLAKIAPKANGDLKFTAAQAISSRAQIAVVIAKTKLKLEPVATEVAEAAMKKAIESSTKILAQLEHDFKGVSTSPNVLIAMQQSHIVHGPKATLATRVATSLDRYGLEMGQQFARIIQAGLISGATTDQMVDALVGHGGPKGKVSIAATEIAPGVVQRTREEDIEEGLFVRYRYWAERIIRTETAYAFNGAKLEQLRQMRADGLDVKKKICAHFDKRTAADSVFVHGQIRELDDSFLDGKGRVYLFPPGRPNDRETILPWFSDWDETPSTKPPTPAEQQKAEELAKPKPKGAPLVPTTTEELHKLEQEARGAIEQHELEQQGRAQQETANASDDEKHAESMAAQALERIAKEIQAKQLALQQLAEQQAAAAAKSAKDAEMKEQAKLDKSLLKKVQKGEGHLAHLDLVELAHKDPEKFAKFINVTKNDPIPLESIKGAINEPKVLDALVKDALDSYAGMSKGQLTSSALEVFKASDKFPAYVEGLATSKKASDKKTLGALYATEGHTPLPKSMQMAKKLPASVAADMIKANGPAAPEPAPPPLSPKAASLPPPAAPAVPLSIPPPTPKVEYTTKSGGGTYIDVYDPEGKKVAFFHETAPGQYKVTPPPKLVSFLAKAFDNLIDATEYAAMIGAEIAKLPKDPDKTPYAHSSPAKDSRFNHDPKRAPKYLEPLAIGAKAAKEIKSLHASAAARFKRDGVELERTQGDGPVDAVLREHGVIEQQKNWSDGVSGCWYSSSKGAKNLAGKIVAHDDGAQVSSHAKKIADQVANSPNDADKFLKYSRAKYAATQAALEHRLDKDLKNKVDPEGYVLLYRGINGAQASHLRKARELGETTEVALNSVSSWTSSHSTAVSFAGRAGVVARARVHISRIFSQFQQEAIAMRRFGHAESEWIVICETKEESFALPSADVTNPYDE